MPYLKGPSGEVLRLCRLGKIKEAYLLAHQVLRHAKKDFGEHHVAYAHGLRSLARVLEQKGDYRYAVKLYEQSLEIYRKAGPTNFSDVAATLNDISMLYWSVGNYLMAESLCNEAIQVDKIARPEENPEYAIHLNNLGLVYASTGRIARAVESYKRAMDIFHRNLDENFSYYAASLNNLAGAYSLWDRDREAEKLLRRTVKLYRGTKYEKYPEFATVLYNLSAIYYSIGNYTAAEPICRESIALTKRTLGKAHPAYANMLNKLAYLYAATNREFEAFNLMVECAAIHDCQIDQVFSITSENQRIHYLKTIQKALDGFLSLVLLCFANSTNAICTLFDIVLRRKAIVMESSIAQHNAILSNRYPDLKLKLQELTVLRNKISQKTLAGPESLDELDTHRGLLEEWNHQRDQMEAELARHVPEMDLEQKLRKVDRHSVAAVLPEETVLVEFTRFNFIDFKALSSGKKTQKFSRYIAFVLPSGKPDDVKMIDLGRAEPIDEMITAFRKSIFDEPKCSNSLVPGDGLRTPRVERSFSIGAKLRSCVFDPLLPVLDNRNHLFLVPEGELTKLPFETLPTNNGHRLIEDYRIRYLSTGRAAMRLKAHTKEECNRPIVVAAPNFDLALDDNQRQPGISLASEAKGFDLYSDAFHYFEPLAYTLVEGQCIAERLGVKPWLQDEALEGRLKVCQSPSILHIATHGFFLEDRKADLCKKVYTKGDGLDGWLSAVAIHQLCSPGMENPMLRSGLVLAGANTWAQKGKVPLEAEDGILTAEDICNMNLVGTELVVLSACDTGLGDTLTGEGVFGLRRAFTTAGAKTLVMSLWKVPDKQTCELMEEFYRRILTGEARAEALRQAQLAIKAKYIDPLYWGAFICQGEPGPLPNRERFVEYAHPRSL